jgi:DNA-directed RNA polymerase specialized sigma24 family protein
MTPLEREALAEGFDRLGEDDRLVIAARYLFGLSRDEAANALSIASGLVDEALESALRRLHARLALSA